MFVYFCVDQKLSSFRLETATNISLYMCSMGSDPLTAFGWGGDNGATSSEAPDKAPHFCINCYSLDYTASQFSRDRSWDEADPTQALSKVDIKSHIKMACS